MMQENTTTTPAWLKPGFFIDLKDKQGDWRVALILNITKTQIRVRYEGWPSKFDENFMLSSSSIRPFRSVIRGYTGQVQSPPLREHYKFTEAAHKQNYEGVLNHLLETMYTKSEFQINQFIRGAHYSWLEFLMTLTYTSKSEIELVFQYFFKHFELIIKYLQDMHKSKNFQVWMSGADENGDVVQGRKAFADSYYEIFDSVYGILEGYPRLRTFFKSNTALITEFTGKTSYLEFMSEYITQIELIELLQQNINKLLNDKNSKISLNFTTALTRLFAALQKTMHDKQKRKLLTQKICQYILRQCSKLPDISTKQQELEIQKIYSTCKMFLLKYSWKGDFLIKFEIININCWKWMILSQKLQRKVKAINNLKVYLYNLTNLQKKQVMMIFNTKQTIQQELRKQEIMHSIFYENQHHEIIKKGCQLATELFKDKFIGMNQLEIVWKSCRHRLEAVRKVMYMFFEDLCKEFSSEELQKLIKLILSEDFAEQMDKTFFYNLFRRIMQYATQQKSKLILRLLELVEQRLPTNRDEIKIFSELLTTKKSYKFGFMDKTCNNIINLIAVQKNNDKILFYLSLLNDILTASGKHKAELDSDSFNIIFRILGETLKCKIKKQQVDEQKNKRDKIYQMLKLIEHLEKLFDFQPHEFMELWELFAQEHNKQLRQSLFLPWIVIIERKGIYKLQGVQLNSCFEDKSLRKQIFNKILRKHPNLDYISLSEMQFKIFKKFMLVVNSQQGNLRQITNYLTGKTYFRVLEKVETLEGIKELFDIFLNCRNEAVVQKAAKLLNQLHLNQETTTQEGFYLRAKKVEDLLNKIQKYIADGMKKSNIRLVKNALFLLSDLAMTVKQTNPMPEQFKFNFHGSRVTKRRLTVKSTTETIILKDLQVIMSSTIKSLKKRICDQLKIPAYNLKMYKQVHQYKKVQQESSHYDDASASSAQSYDNSKSSNYHTVKKTSLDEIHNEILYSSISCLMLPENQSVIVVKEINNVIYENIQKFVNHKISENLLKILGDPDYYSKQSSKLAYHILIEISSSITSASEILNNLINLLTTKNKNKNLPTIGLCNQSLQFKMYFCRNINKLQIEQLCQFLGQKNSHIYIDLFKELQKQIISPLQIQLFMQIISFIKKGLTKNKITSAILSSNTVYSCMINILQFNAGLKQTKQYKKQQKGIHIGNEVSVFMDCFYILDMIEGQRVGEFVIQHQDFSRIMVLLYKVITRSEFSQLFENKIAYYFKLAQKLSKQSEQIMYHIIFEELYSTVIKLGNKSNSSFFKLTRDLILISSPSALTTLFHKKLENKCFWQNCLQVIDNQFDHQTETQKQNKLLSGHLIILDALIKKNPASITQQICRKILFNCICYKEGQTYGNNIKCISKNSIQAALSVLATIIKKGQSYGMLIISELRTNQQTKYWRTPDFWNVNIELEMKSPCGYVGLENVGCICYLNSFTQTLFMNEEFRREVINFNAVDPCKDYSLLHELRKIFLNLQYSNQKYLNPVPFTKTIKNTEDKPMIKLFEQMDIEQYSSILFDKIEKLLPKDQDFVKQIFGGTYSNDIISQECKHCSQREERFLSMQLDVKANLSDSLKTLVKGELLEGQNAYYCQKCNKKVKALKRMSIKKLPNNLIICLKRFEYNFETDQKFKVNSCCQFPRQLTLQPYSQQYLSSEQQLQQFNQKQGQSGLVQLLPQEYFEYRLKGVIIHTGYSESGHYYALIQSSRQTEKWIEFNDSHVTEFDIENLADQAFGSDDIGNSKVKNAYMLVYERKNKITHKQQPTKMQPQQKIQQKQYTNASLSPSYELTPESQKILQQINSRNKEIQTFHTIFTPEYNQFIYEIIQHSVNNNHALFTQFRSVIKQFNPNLVEDNVQEMEILLKSTNQGSQEFIEEVMKFYLEYCLFVKSREINLQHFIEFLYEVECLLSTQMLRGVIDYYLGQLRQQLLVQQLFIEVTFKEKLIILANFTCELIIKRLKYKKDLNDPVDILVLQVIESFMCVMIQNGNCCNELMLIMRRLMEQYPYYVAYFQKMNLSTLVFQIVSGISQSAEDKISKIQRLRSQVLRIIQEDFSNNSTSHNKTDMQQEISQSLPYKYQIRTVKQNGRCPLKQQSPQQVWSFLYIMYQYQTNILRQHKQENQYLIQSEEESKQNQESIGKIMQFKREIFLSQFNKLKNSRIDHFIEQCQGSKASRALALFLCQVMHNSEQITDRLLACVLKGLKALEAVNFRPHLVLLYYMVMHKDQLVHLRCLSAVKMLINALVEKNSKYFSETDIIHQWIMKLALHSGNFVDEMTRTEEGVDLFNQIIQRIEILKRPSSELMKKHKNPNFQRLNYIIHGLTVSTEQKDYDTLYQTKKLFFTKLFHEQPFPKDLQLRIQPLTITEPTFKQLTRKLRPGQIVFYLLNRKWAKIIIRSYRYGLVSVSRLLKQPSQMKTEHEHNFVNINGIKIDIGEGYKMSEELSQIWEMEQKLVSIGLEQLNKSTNPHKQQNKQQKSPDPSSRIDINKSEPDSNLSYQNSNKD